MAKTPKPPGKNGPSTPISLIDALEQLAPSHSDSHWRSEIANAALVPTAKLGGEKRARKLLEWLKPMPYWYVRGLFSVGRGLALAGESAAKSVIAEGEASFATAGIEGQFGTLARIEAARAYHALDAQPECDRALDDALSYATREQNYPTQPRPWLAVALARTGRIERALADLRERLPNQRLSFDDELALKLVLEQVVRRGDAATFAKIDAEQTAANGYSVAEALADSALAAVEQGHGDALVAMCVEFAKDKPYGPRTMSRIAWTLADAGELELARRVVDRTRDACRDDAQGHDHFLRSIDKPFEDADSISDGSSFGLPFRVGYRVAPDRALELAAAREAKLLAAVASNDRTAMENLGHLGVALCAIGRADKGDALLAKSIEAAQSLDGTSKSYVLKSVALAACEFDLGEHAHSALKKISSKPMKADVCRALNLVYVRQRDFAGASMIIMIGEPRPGWLMMRHCDALSVAAGTERVFSNYA
ncbi:MAG: hypothetical protein JNK05_04070 [Myxococcales bacterium]|nr:hypothetical protein [Myxococcales bacterium]